MRYCKKPDSWEFLRGAAGQRTAKTNGTKPSKIETLSHNPERHEGKNPAQYALKKKKKGEGMGSRRKERFESKKSQKNPVRSEKKRGAIRSSCACKRGRRVGRSHKKKISCAEKRRVSVFFAGEGTHERARDNSNGVPGKTSSIEKGSSPPLKK